MLFVLHASHVSGGLFVGGDCPKTPFLIFKTFVLELLYFNVRHKYHKYVYFVADCKLSD